MGYQYIPKYTKDKYPVPPEYLSIRNNMGGLLDSYKVNAPQMNTDFSGLRAIKDAETQRQTGLASDAARVGGITGFSGKRGLGALAQARGMVGNVGSAQMGGAKQLLDTGYETEKLGREAMMKQQSLNSKAQKANIEAIYGDITNQNQYKKNVYQNLLDMQQGREMAKAMEAGKKRHQPFGFLGQVMDTAHNTLDSIFGQR